MPKSAFLCNRTFCNRGGPALSSEPMPATPDELFAYLDALGIAQETVRHAAVFAVEEARELRGAISGEHTKNLFLRDTNRALYLVVAPEDAAIELRSPRRPHGSSR